MVSKGVVLGETFGVGNPCLYSSKLRTAVAANIRIAVMTFFRMVLALPFVVTASRLSGISGRRLGSGRFGHRRDDAGGLSCGRFGSRRLSYRGFGSRRLSGGRSSRLLGCRGLGGRTLGLGRFGSGRLGCRRLSGRCLGFGNFGGGRNRLLFHRSGGFFCCLRCRLGRIFRSGRFQITGDCFAGDCGFQGIGGSLLNNGASCQQRREQYQNQSQTTNLLQNLLHMHSFLSANSGLGLAYLHYKFSHTEKSRKFVTKIQIIYKIFKANVKNQHNRPGHAGFDCGTYRTFFKKS
jgi:hypothetical protein